MGHEPEGEADPRFTALGLNPGRSGAVIEDGAETERFRPVADDDLATRLNGLVPGKGKGGSDATATQVVVVGLVSVASIASFKRHLGRVSGVQSVGVSSGPDGEFVFAVTHTRRRQPPRRRAVRCRASRLGSPARRTASST
jgi:hypothetical protein